jgi:hypothetical protein
VVSGATHFLVQAKIAGKWTTVTKTRDQKEAASAFKAYADPDGDAEAVRLGAGVPVDGKLKWKVVGERQIEPEMDSEPEPEPFRPTMNARARTDPSSDSRYLLQGWNTKWVDFAKADSEEQAESIINNLSDDCGFHKVRVKYFTSGKILVEVKNNNAKNNNGKHLPNGRSLGLRIGRVTGGGVILSIISVLIVVGMCSSPNPDKAAKNANLVEKSVTTGQEESNSPSAMVALDNARNAYKKDDYATALRLFRPLADQGNVIAQFYLGVMCYNGYGVNLDYSQAINLFRKAADQGNAMAQFNVGVMYNNGQGVPKDEAQAIGWYQKAADQGYADAQSALRVMQDKAGHVVTSKIRASGVCFGDDPRYVINGGEVYDKETNLTWQRCSVGQRWGGASCIGVIRNLGWGETMQQANGSWRLPSPNELLSLLTANCKNPGVNKDAFPDMDTDDFHNNWYWTNETFPPEGLNSGRTTRVAFKDGSLAYSDKVYQLGHELAVRLVRSGR